MNTKRIKATLEKLNKEIDSMVEEYSDLDIRIKMASIKYNNLKDTLNKVENENQKTTN